MQRKFYWMNIRGDQMNLISWNTTNRCNMHCAHCYRNANADKEGTKKLGEFSEELTTEEAKRLIDEIKAANFKMMIFSGGEPMMREDLNELGLYAKKIGLIPVLGTNATMITTERAHSLKEAGFVAAGVSLDSLNEEKLSSFRGLPNALYHTLEGIKNLQKAGIRIQIHTTIMDWNLDEIMAITDKAVEIGASSHHFFFLVPTGRAVLSGMQGITDAQCEKALRMIMEKQKSVTIELKPTCAPQFMRIAEEMGVATRFTRGCLAGISYCIISPNGDVRPCAYLNNTLGNVRELSFDRIWDNHPTLKNLRTYKYSGKCGNCEYMLKCGGCRARAFYTTGDFMAEDPSCIYHRKKQTVGEHTYGGKLNRE